MNRTTSIVLFASIFAVAVGTVGLSENSLTSLMVSASPQSQESMGILGHVEYKVLDETGSVKAYMQNDNIVVEDGQDCAAQSIFNSAGTVGACITTADFRYIGIGNGSSGTINVANQTLADGTDDGTGDCASSGSGGDMARKIVDNTDITAATGGTGAVVVLDTSTAPFNFDASNATTVYDSGVFNAGYNGGGSECPSSQTSGTHWNMFSRQLLNTNQGITVTDGDSLSVKWTITVG